MKTSPNVFGSCDATITNYSILSDKMQILEINSWNPGLQGFIGQNVNKTCHMLIKNLWDTKFLCGIVVEAFCLVVLHSQIS